MNLEYLKQEYPELFKSEELTDCSVLYNLIFLLKELEVHNYQYQLAKKFLIKYIEEVDDTSFGYDVVNFDKLISVLLLFEGEEKLRLIEFYINRLRQYDQNINIEILSNLRFDCIKELLRQKFSLRYINFYIFKIVLGKPIYISGLLVITIFFLTIMFLPAPIEKMEMFTLKLESYSDNYFLNLLYNVIALLLDVDNDFELQPLNNYGAPIIFCGRIVYTLVIIGTIGQFLNSKFQKLRDEF